MHKRVDSDDSEEDITGYSYENEDGDIESVGAPLGDYLVTIGDSIGNNVRIYTTDIENLIKALKAAYKHQTGGVIE